jgi:hypothetical protein
MEKKSSASGKIVPDKSKAGSEKDADDLVHSGETGEPALSPEEDPDDAVHRLKRSEKSENELADPDDLVHDADDDDEEDR